MLVQLLFYASASAVRQAVETIGRMAHDLNVTDKLVRRVALRGWARYTFWACCAYDRAVCEQCGHRPSKAQTRAQA